MLPAIFPCAATVTYFPPLYSSLPCDNFSRDVGLGEKEKKKKWEHSFLEINAQGNERSGFFSLSHPKPTQISSSKQSSASHGSVGCGAAPSIHRNGPGFSMAALDGTQPLIHRESPCPVTPPCNSTSNPSSRSFPSQAQPCPCPVALKPRGFQQRHSPEPGWGRNWDPKPPSSGSQAKFSPVW